MKNFSQELKAATQEAHETTESTFGQVIRTLRSEAQYAEFVSFMHNFFSPIYEKSLPYLQPLLGGDRERRSPEWLLKDAHSINPGLQPEPMEPAVEINNPAQALGAFYVWEGSSNGGPYIASMLSKHLGIGEGSLQYFSGYGKETRAMWKQFQEKMDNAGLSEEQQAETIQTAQATFRKMNEALKQRFGAQLAG